MTRARFALLALLAASLLLVGARCDAPRAVDPDTVLYVLAQPQGSTFVFPADPATPDIVQQARDYYLEASFGQKRLEGADAPALGGDRVGPFVLAAPFFCGGEDLFAEDALAAVHPAVDLTRYDHVVVIAPAPGCGFNGFDFGPRVLDLGGEFVYVDFVFVNAVSLYYGGGGTIGAGLVVHELGHQLGLGHSGGMQCPRGTLQDTGCSEGEYLSFIDTMGASVFFGHFNAHQKENLGWLRPSEVVEVTGPGLYALTPLETPAPGPKALKLRRQDDSWLYVEYRIPFGFDDFGVAGFTGGAIVHVTRPRYVGAPVLSYVLQGQSGAYAMTPGEVFQDARGHRIEVVDVAPDAILVDVQPAPSAEGTPPTLTASRSAGPTPDLTTVRVQASDASGVARVEVHTRTFGSGNFDWDNLRPLATWNAPPGSAAVDVSLEIALASVTDLLEATVTDGAGNVARRPVF